MATGEEDLDDISYKKDGTLDYKGNHPAIQIRLENGNGMKVHYA